MTYDTKNKILHTGVYEEVKLTNLEHKLLVCLSSGDLATYEEMTKYLDKTKNELICLKRRLLEDTKHELDIKIVVGVGFRLENENYFK